MDGAGALESCASGVCRVRRQDSRHAHSRSDGRYESSPAFLQVPQTGSYKVTEAAGAGGSTGKDKIMMPVRRCAHSVLLPRCGPRDPNGGEGITGVQGGATARALDGAIRAVAVNRLHHAPRRPCTARQVIIETGAEIMVPDFIKEGGTQTCCSNAPLRAPAWHTLPLSSKPSESTRAAPIAPERLSSYTRLTHTAAPRAEMIKIDTVERKYLGRDNS